MLTNLESEFYNLLEGGVLIISIYHLIIYLKNKQIIYLNYALYFFSLFALFFIATSRYLRGLGFDYFWGYYASYIFYIIFTRNLLNTKETLPKWDRYIKVALYFSIGFYIFYILLSVFHNNHREVNGYLFEYYYISFFIFAILTYFKVFRLKHKIAYYFITGSSIYIFLAFATNLIYALVGQKEFATMFGFDSLLFSYSGMYIEAIMFAIIVAEKQKQIQIERDEIKKEFETLQLELDSLKQKKSIENEEKENELINLKSKAILNSSEILYIKSDGHYVEYFIENNTKPEIDRNSLSEVLKILPSNSFVRIHKSFIVNIYRIKIINATKVMLDNGVWINLSRTYKQKLKDILHKEE